MNSEPQLKSVGAGEGVPGLVSVIIPTFNRAYIVGRAIDSVLAQTHRSVEVVIADDGSTDDTEQVVRQYDERVRYVRQSNSGPSAARNLGMAHAHGEYVAFLDSDDVWVPWKLAIQVEILRRFPEVGMVWTDMTAVDHEGRVKSEAYLRTMYSAYSRIDLSTVMAKGGVLGELSRDLDEGVATRPFWHGDIFQYMLLGSLVHTSTVLLRRTRLAAMGGFDESLKISGEDYEFHLRTCFGGDVAFADISSISYRVGADDQLTDSRYMVHIARNNLITLNRWLARGRERISAAQQREVRKSVGVANGWLGSEEFALGNRKVARHHLWESVRLGCGSRRIAAILALSMFPAGITDSLLSQYRALKPRSTKS